MNLNLACSRDLDTMKRLVKGLLAMDKCEGTEPHHHYRLADSSIVTHTHNHTPVEGEFNRLHHHIPTDHEGLSEDELYIQAVTYVPF